MSTDGKSEAELLGLSIEDASELIRAKRISPVDLVQACLARIERLNPHLNAFITITPELALKQARDAEAEIQRASWRGPLHGIPIALKDLFDTAGVRTTAASGVFKDRMPSDDAKVVRHLKAAGAVILGKLNMHEFAYGASSVISYFGPVRNPWELSFSTGGSSGGSAAAVAAGLCFVAIGSDTGGSIRQPAAFCSIVGLKPTYGRVSMQGVIPLSESLDHIGPMTRSVRDAALTLQVMVGDDSNDTDYLTDLSDSTSSLRLGIPRLHFYEGLDSEIEAAMDNALSLLKKLTFSQREIEIPSANEVAITVQRAEAYSYHLQYMAACPELYQTDTLIRIGGTAEIEEVDYTYSRRELEQCRQTAADLFETVDLLITPTTAVPPFSISELLEDLEKLRAKELLTVRNTRPFNLLGLPTISIPCGFTRQGLPIGMQISGPPGGDATVLRLAHAYEQATDWHKRKPNLVLAA